MKRQTYYVYSHSIGGSLLYIGMGTRARLLSDWDRGKKWKQRIKDISQVELRVLAAFFSRAKASRIEKALIEFCQPPCNTNHVKRTIAPIIPTYAFGALGIRTQRVSAAIQSRLSK